MPGMVGETSVYQTSNFYRSNSGRIYPNNSNTTVTPQDCPVFSWKFVECAGFAALTQSVCAALCAVCGSTGHLCSTCVSCVLGSPFGGTYQFCHDCLPGTVTSVIDSLLTGGGGGGPPPPPPCCPAKTPFCCGSCVPRPGGGLKCDGACIGPGQHCP